jgi:uncharacterized membrane protein
MSDRSLRATAVSLALAGAAIMAYLLVERHRGGAPVCVGGGCAAVQHSKYAEIFGLPVALLGLGGFLAVALSSVASGERARVVQATLVLSALGFSAYLLVVELLVIHAVCQWCVAGDVALSGLAVVVLLRSQRVRESA